MLKSIKQDFKPITWVLILFAIIANGTSGWIVAKSNLPLFLDTFGTMFIAIVAGPWAGALTGLVTNIIFSFISTGYALYSPVPLLIGLAVGFFDLPPVLEPSCYCEKADCQAN